MTTYIFRSEKFEKFSKEKKRTLLMYKVFDEGQTDIIRLLDIYRECREHLKEIRESYDLKELAELYDSEGNPKNPDIPIQRIRCLLDRLEQQLIRLADDQQILMLRMRSLEDDARMIYSLIEKEKFMNTITCPNCGEEMEIGSVCTECGTPDYSE